MGGRKERKMVKKEKPLSNLIRSRMQLYNMVPDELAVALDLSVSALYSRLKEPCRFTAGELKVLIKKLHIKEDELYKEIIKLSKVHERRTA